MLRENVKEFGLGWDLLTFDYVKFEVNGSGKKKKKVANIANDEEALWFCCHLLLLIDNKIFIKKKKKKSQHNPNPKQMISQCRIEILELVSFLFTFSLGEIIRSTKGLMKWSSFVIPTNKTLPLMQIKKI